MQLLCVCVCVCLVWGKKEKEVAWGGGEGGGLCVLSAQLGQAFVNFAQAAIPHRAGQSQRRQPTSGHLSMWKSMCMALTRVTV